QLDPNCDDDITNWPHWKRAMASLLIPWIAVTKALRDLSHLECWAVKQANLTSKALSELLEEEETTRHATLQIRAATDFLLLAHGHGCKDFDGFCCFNLSSKSKSIHATIQEMQNHISKIQQETGGWTESLFSNFGLSGWGASIIKSIMWFVLVFFLIIFV
ncbi:hypothetical protein N302_16167, partial [Corvus brachyrhynchos]